MMGLSRVSGQRGRETAICSGYATQGDTPIDYFRKNGVEARLDSKDTITHSKVVVIDDAVILGATNWSYSGLKEWHNTDILISKREIVDFFINYFEEKFNSNVNKELRHLKEEA